MNPGTDVVSKIRQYLTELDSEKANLFMALMRDQRAQRCLVHSTLGFPSAVTPDNAEELLEEVRLSVAAEIREEAARREAEMRRNHEEALARVNERHQREALARETELLEVKRGLATQEASAAEEIDRRIKEAAGIQERLRDVEKAVESDIDSRVQRAAAAASRAASLLKSALILVYVALVGMTYWFTTDLIVDYRIYALTATVVLAFLGYWIVPEMAYDTLARRLWSARFRSRCVELGVAEQLSCYEIDLTNRRVMKKQPE
jgi:CHASE3 domain sensor protein